MPFNHVIAITNDILLHFINYLEHDELVHHHVGLGGLGLPVGSDAGQDGAGGAHQLVHDVGRGRLRVISGRHGGLGGSWGG